MSEGTTILHAVSWPMSRAICIGSSLWPCRCLRGSQGQAYEVIEETGDFFDRTISLVVLGFQVSPGSFYLPGAFVPFSKFVLVTFSEPRLLLAAIRRHSASRRHLAPSESECSMAMTLSTLKSCSGKCRSAYPESFRSLCSCHESCIVLFR